MALPRRAVGAGGAIPAEGLACASLTLPEETPVADLTVVAVLVAQPGKEDVVRDALVALVPPTLQEEGCVSYALSESAAAPGTFVTVEVWRRQADMDAHMQTPHVAQAFAAAGDALAAAPGIHPLVPLAS